MITQTAPVPYSLIPYWWGAQITQPLNLDELCITTDTESLIEKAVERFPKLFKQAL